MLTPIETSQGFSQKIMYLHVPTVIVTYLAFFIVFAFSIAYLWKRDLMFDRIASRDRIAFLCLGVDQRSGLGASHLGNLLGLGRSIDDDPVVVSDFYGVFPAANVHRGP